MGMAWSFGLLGIVFLLGMSILCGCDTSWHDSPEVQCDLPKTFNTITFCGVLFHLFALIQYQRLMDSESGLGHPVGIYALRILWRMKLPDDQRRLILAGFAGSVWTSIAVGVCFVIMFGPDGAGLSRRTIRPLLGHVMASVSLMVCNAMVIFASVYRLVRKDKDLERSISEAVSNSNMSPLTTIVLSGPGSLDGLSQSSYRRGISHSGYSFSERSLASSSSSSLFTTSRTVPQTGRSA
ncbi:hypothetical protein BD779DRAFT_1551686 [Infundibulicybe gibba]|nr:hypothetical protein BD779DRAFT_1551686 [Infundibulicybe gibba]